MLQVVINKTTNLVLRFHENAITYDSSLEELIEKDFDFVEFEECYYYWNVVDETFVMDDCLRKQKLAKRCAINTRTSKIILAGFIYLDILFTVSSEDQSNYSGMAIAKDYLDYDPQSPNKITVKGANQAGADAYLFPANANEVVAFYIQGLIHVKTCLSGGWYLKGLAESATTQEELDAIIDNRPIVPSGEWI